MAPVVRALRERGVPHVVCYTNQHALAEMSDVFFAAFDYQPDWRLDGGFTPGRCLDALTSLFRERSVTSVVVQGDTTSTLVGALAGLYAGSRIVHLEAGLRSFDEEMLEERHRRAVDHFAHELLTYTEKQSMQLQFESARGRVTRVGNPMVDVTKLLEARIDERMAAWPDDAFKFLYVTMHRKEFTDQPGRMVDVFSAIASAAAMLKVGIVYPVHPRTKDVAKRHGIAWPFPPCEPVDVIESLARIRYAAAVVTDSGGIQEEAAIYGTPCVTVRENTERWETVDAGLNVVTGFDTMKIVDAILNAKRTFKATEPLYGAIGVGQRVVDVLLNQG